MANRNPLLSDFSLTDDMFVPVPGSLTMLSVLTSLTMLAYAILVCFLPESVAWFNTAAHAGLLHAAASVLVAILGVAAIRAQWPLLEAGYLKQHRTITRLVLLCVLPVLGANALYLALVGLADELGSGVAGGHALLVLRCVSGAEVLLSFIVTYFTWNLSQKHNIERLLPDLGAASRTFDVSARGAINGSAASHVGPLPVRDVGGALHTQRKDSGVLEESTFMHSPRKGAGYHGADYTAVDMTLGSVGDFGGARSLPGPSSFGMMRDLPVLAGGHSRRGTGGSGALGSDGFLGRLSAAQAPLGDVDLPSSLNEAHDMIMQLHRSQQEAWEANKALHEELGGVLGGGDDDKAAATQAKMQQLAEALQANSALSEQVRQLQERVHSCTAAAEQARAAAAEAASRAQREAARAQKLAMQVEVEQAANLELQRMLESMGGGATEVSMSDLSDVEGGMSAMEGALVGSYSNRAAATMLNQHRRGSSRGRTVSNSSVGSL